MGGLRAFIAGGWRRREVLLFLMAGAVPLSFATWSALLNNFAIERAAFDGADMGILQSQREVPGFLAFAVVFVLLVMREQTLALVALLLLGVGTALTGWFPSVVGLWFTTVLMSLGFHYYYTVTIPSRPRSRSNGSRRRGCPRPWAASSRWARPPRSSPSE